MWAKENPRFKFVRPGKAPDGLKISQSQAAWVNVLRGKALEEYLSARIITRNIRRRAPGLLTRGPGGKPGQRPRPTRPTKGTK